MGIYKYIAVMAITTYLIRMLPLTFFRKEIKNKYIKSFLKYIPVSCLTAMTVPAIFTATGNIVAGIAAFIAAVILALYKKSLVTVAAGCCAAVLLTDFLMALL